MASALGSLDTLRETVSTTYATVTSNETSVAAAQTLVEE